MTKFVGGPYDGRDLAIGSGSKTIRLPPIEDWDNTTRDKGATIPYHCPNVYELDDSADPPQYRYVEQSAEKK